MSDYSGDERHGILEQQDEGEELYDEEANAAARGDGKKRSHAEKNEAISKKESKKMKNDYKNYTSRGEGKSNDIHPGSFAHPSLRELFNTELPSMRKELNDGDKRIKRKVAFLLAYLGTNYGGFQMNEEQRTLQAEIELALYKCQFITPANFGYPFKYGWSTSGRTDKGVHACAQVCSAKIEMLPNHTMDQVREELNNALPSDIRVLEVNRVSKSFCAKTQRDKVRYQYMIPSFLLEDIAKVKDMFQKAGCPNNNRPAGDPLSPEEIALIKTQLDYYRATPQQLALLKDAFRAYEGTHSFHNYSKGVKSDEARSNRYIVSFRMEDPIVFENGMEWIPTQVLGQSFLLHQIRKMVAMAIDVARGAAPLSTLERAFLRDEIIRVAPAPAQGLYLDMSFYNLYNRKKHKTNQDYPDLDWTKEDSDVYQRWKEFRNGTLMTHVVAEEHKEGNFVKYLYQQEFLNDYRLYYKLDESKKTNEADTKIGFE